MKTTRLLSLVMLITCCKAAAPAPPRFGGADNWLGMYLGGQKIGYSFESIQKHGDRYRLENRTSMKITAMGTVEELTSTLTAWTGLDFTLQEFDFELINRLHPFRAQGRFDGSKLEIEIKTAGAVERKTLEAKRPLYLSGILGPVLVELGIKPKKTYTLVQFDPTLLSIVETEVTVAGEERLAIGDSSYAAWKIESSLLNMTSTTWIDHQGRTLKEEAPPGIMMVVEPPAQALADASPGSTVDLLALLSVRIDTIFADPRACRFLKIEIDSVAPNQLDLATDNQKVLSTDPLVLEIASPDPQALPKVTLPVSNMQEFLQPTAYMQSKNPEIIGQARIIIGDSRFAAEAAQKLLDWVYQTLDKRPTASVPSALDVLKTKEGDCNEHSILFGAFCRAVGIPCKVCVGVVGMKDGFYYHAWDKVWLGRWISVDPTFGQFPADASHIEFKEGEIAEQAKVLSVVGKIKIRILEYH